MERSFCAGESTRYQRGKNLMVEKPLTQAEIELTGQYWESLDGGQVRIRYDKAGYSHFHSLQTLVVYLARRAELSEKYRQEFMDIYIPTHWLEAATKHTDTPMLHNKLLVQRTAEKLRGI